MPENKEAMEIYSTVSNQMIVSGMGDPIDINIVAIKTVMDLYGVDNQPECFKKVVMIARHIIKGHQEKSKTDGKVK